jgi:hypothetical protein
VVHRAGVGQALASTPLTPAFFIRSKRPTNDQPDRRAAGRASSVSSCETENEEDTHLFYAFHSPEVSKNPRRHFGDVDCLLNGRVKSKKSRGNSGSLRVIQHGNYSFTEAMET